MTDPHGSFLWYELLTTDPDAAAAFYGEVIGWTTRDAGQPGMDYRLLSAAGTDVGGMASLPGGAADAGLGPVWLGYLAVDDVDQAARAVEAAGGAIHMPAQNIPGIGRFAFLADPQGAPFYVMRGTGEGSSSSYQPRTPGHVAWNELSTADPEAAYGFYAPRFGWAKGEAMPMGEMGTYQILTRGGAHFGAVMRSPAAEAPPRWTYYFQVDDIDAASSRARKAGATILHGPAEVPGGELIIIATDPQGATFALVGPRTSEES